MDINIISDIRDFKKIQMSWVNLFNSESYSVFQSFEFNYYSWKYELSKNRLNYLCIVVLNDALGVYSILPLYIDRNKVLRFINDDHADFCDFITREKINLSKVFNHLRSEVDFRFISLINVCIKSNAYEYFQDVNIKHKLFKIISEFSLLNIKQGDFPYNVPHYRSHQKNRINKAYKKHKDRQSVIFDCKEHMFPKKDILYLRDSMIENGIREYGFLTVDRLSLIEKMYNSGLVVLHFVKKGNRINACNIMIKSSSDQLMFWIDLYDDLQIINIFSYIVFIKSFSLDRPLCINFGRGRYFYKVSNFAPSFKNLYQICLFHNKWHRLRFMMLDYIISLLKFIYKKIKKD